MHILKGLFNIPHGMAACDGHNSFSVQLYNIFPNFSECSPPKIGVLQCSLYPISF